MVLVLHQPLQVTMILLPIFRLSPSNLLNYLHQINSCTTLESIYIYVFHVQSFNFLACFWIKQNVLPVSKQLEYFLHYKIHLRKLVGEKKAKDIIRYGVFVLSMGTNDFLQNYFLQSMRTEQFSLQEYQNYLVSCMSHDIQVLSLSRNLRYFDPYLCLCLWILFLSNY